MPIYILQKGKKNKGLGIMTLNVSMGTALQLENKENLKNAVRNILNNSGASSETAQKIIDKTIFDSDRQLKEIYTNPQLAVIKASAQITLNNSLKETLKYLKEHANKKEAKKHVLGEIWDTFAAKNDASEKNPYRGELCDFQINYNAKNIFAA